MAARDLTRAGGGLLRRLSRQPLGVLPQEEMRNLFVADNPEFHLPAQPIGWTPWWFQHTGLADGRVGASRRSLYVARSLHRGTRINPLNLPVDSRLAKMDIDMKWAWISSKKLPFMTWREDFHSRRWLTNFQRQAAQFPGQDMRARIARSEALKGIVQRSYGRPEATIRSFLKDKSVAGVTGPAIARRRGNARLYGIVNKTL